MEAEQPVGKKMEQGKEQRPKSARRKMTWLDWVLLLLATAIMIWLVVYSMSVLMTI